MRRSRSLRVITGLKQAAAVSIEAPADLRVDVVPDATRQPVQARVRVHWARGAATLFEAPDRVRMLHAFTRAIGRRRRAAASSRRRDQAAGAPPADPLRRACSRASTWSTARCRRTAMHTWKITAMDLFGRVSPAAAISDDVRDTIPPPAPGTVDVRAAGRRDHRPVMDGRGDRLRLAAGARGDRAGSCRFRAPSAQGVVSSADAPLPATLGTLRNHARVGGRRGADRVARPRRRATRPPGVTVTAVVCPDRRRRQHASRSRPSPIAIPFDATGYAHIAAAIRAIDDWDNASGFAVGRAERVDLTRSASAVVRRAGATGDAARRAEPLLVQRAASGHRRRVGAGAARHQRRRCWPAPGTTADRLRGAGRSAAGRPASRAERAPIASRSRPITSSRCRPTAAPICWSLAARIAA